MALAATVPAQKWVLARAAVAARVLEPAPVDRRQAAQEPVAKAWLARGPALGQV